MLACVLKIFQSCRAQQNFEPLIGRGVYADPALHWQSVTVSGY